MKLWTLMLLGLVLACQHRGDLRNNTYPLDNTRFQKGEAIATISDNRLLEASGLQYSRANPGYLWTHNDSEGQPSVYLINQAGEIRLTVRLQGVVNIDWEDIAIDDEYIYVGDIGDNRAVRPMVYVYKFKEPLLGDQDSITILSEDWEQMKLTYENGARDAETLMFDPQSRELIMVSKRDENGLIYSFPFNAGLTTIKALGKINLTQFTAGDISKSGEIILKNYDDIFYWPASHLSVVERLKSGPDFRLKYTVEPQGEALAFDRVGNIYTLSEHNQHSTQNLYIYKKQ